jgi:hypothetical protein
LHDVVDHPQVKLTDFTGSLHVLDQFLGVIDKAQRPHQRLITLKLQGFHVHNGLKLHAEALREDFLQAPHEPPVCNLTLNVSIESQYRRY